MSTPTADLDVLTDAIEGEVLRPGTADYETVRRPQIARFEDIEPLAVVRCVSAADVAAAIAFARRHGLEIAPRSGGHCFAGRSSTRGIVIDVGPLRSISVADGIALVGAGARLGDVYDALEAHGLTIAAGCGPTVGIAGLVLGGGLGILGRTHGLTADQLAGAEVVLADGRVVACDEHHHADLFWALRGAGGGQFGVVTRLALRTVPAPAATAVHVVWPQEQAAAAISAWQSWSPDAPDEVAVSLLVTAGADSPPRVHLFGAVLAIEARTAQLIEPAIVAEPASAELVHGPYRQVKRRLAEHGPAEEHPGYAFSKSEFFRQALPDETIAALVDHLASARNPGEARELDFSPWAGAYNRVPTGATAFAHRQERFLLKHGVVADPGGAAAATGWLERSWAIVHPWGSGGVYANFPDPGLADPRAYHGSNYERLVRVKAEYDPDDVFRFPQSLPVS